MTLVNAVGLLLALVAVRTGVVVLARRAAAWEERRRADALAREWAAVERRWRAPEGGQESHFPAL
ncbi:hypothetical protein [Pseudonocardia sp. TRM90224]|uniref:hypothetical protein n=1 Tax=Pseudonocardia sp. TRM90224 TaxID=2812678 RepID=UPI001E4EF41C|nr:hypothetical protein [Pseudonocardia sp. TRM90224]